jgi:hypothetical protein
VFNDILTSNASIPTIKTNCIFLRGTSFEEVSSILDFIYEGEALVKRERLNLFLSIAEDLKIHGLSSVNVLTNSKGTKEKEKYRNCHSPVSYDIDDCTFIPCVPILSTASPANQSRFQSKKSSSSDIEDCPKNMFNLHGNIGPAHCQSQNHQTIHVADLRAGIAGQTPFDGFQCQSFDNISIKEELPDTNITNSYTYNDEQNITVAEEELTNQCKGHDQLSIKGRKQTIVWNFFDRNKRARSTATGSSAICTLCGRKVKFCWVRRKNGNISKNVSNLWSHLRRNHDAVYQQHGNSS